MIPSDEALCRRLTLPPDSPPASGIGELSEKTLHARLKAAYAPDPACREVPVGRFVADIFDGSEIVEIQTASFRNLARKLPAFLEVAPVTVVYPLPAVRRLMWVSPLDGSTAPPRRCPRRAYPIHALKELAAIRELLLSPRLRVELLFLDMDEYRLLSGKNGDSKHHTRRIERIPQTLRERVILENAADYAAILTPAIREALPPCFSAADLRTAVKPYLSSRGAYAAIHVLAGMGILDPLPPSENPAGSRAARYRIRERSDNR